MGFFDMLFFLILYSLKGQSNSLKDDVTILTYLVCTVDKAPVAHKKIISKACPVTISGLTI